MPKAPSPYAAVRLATSSPLLLSALMPGTQLTFCPGRSRRSALWQSCNRDTNPVERARALARSSARCMSPADRPASAPPLWDRACAQAQQKMPSAPLCQELAVNAAG